MLLLLDGGGGEREFQRLILDWVEMWAKVRFLTTKFDFGRFFFFLKLKLKKSFSGILSFFLGCVKIKFCVEKLEKVSNYFVVLGWFS